MRAIPLLFAAGFSMIAVAACSDPALRPGTPAQTTGASLQSSHTVDNAGFVDNGGRTSDEFPMGELGGARATEGGGRPPAASPETIPLPTGGNTESSFRPGTTAPRTGDEPVSSDGDERLASALCDRERTCNARAFKSQDSCVSAKMKAPMCPHGAREAPLTACLKAVRLAPCNGSFASLQGCRAADLCAP